MGVAVATILCSYLGLSVCVAWKRVAAVGVLIGSLYSSYWPHNPLIGLVVSGFGAFRACELLAETVARRSSHADNQAPAATLMIAVIGIPLRVRSASQLTTARGLQRVLATAAMWAACLVLLRLWLRNSALSDPAFPPIAGNSPYTERPCAPNDLVAKANLGLFRTPMAGLLSLSEIKSDLHQVQIRIAASYAMPPHCDGQAGGGVETAYGAESFFVVVVWALSLYSTMACGEFAAAAAIECTGIGNCEQPFGIPVGTTSLAQFWAASWHRALASSLRTAVYAPTVIWARSSLGSSENCAAACSIALTFAVSGLVHAAIARFALHASWHLQLLFFVLQGAAVIIERGVCRKRAGSVQTLLHRVGVFVWLLSTAPLFMAAYEAPGVSVLDRIAVLVWGLYV